MKFLKTHAGKWVATKGEKVVAASTDFAKLRTKMNTRKDKEEICFNLVPKGYITGAA